MPFSVLDDLILADSLGIVPDDETLKLQPVFSDIGPTLEYHIHQSSGSGSLVRLESLPKSPAVLALLEAEQTGSTSVSQRSLADLSARRLEVIRLSVNVNDLSDPVYIAFGKRFQAAAEKSGFRTRIAAGIVGAFWEMVDNAIIHSNDANIILAAYQASPTGIAYAIGDNGVGVLNSLRMSSFYSELDDHATALKVAMTDGESRFRSQPGRGRGFRHVFLSLAALRGQLRFRSGDHSLELDGRSPSLVNASLHQRAFFRGFLASVQCQAD